MKNVFLLFILLFLGNGKIESTEYLVKQLPVQHDGRVKPLDTVARNALLILHGSQTLKYQGGKISAIEWLLKVLMEPKEARQIQLIRVDHPDLLHLLGESQKGRRYFSIAQLEPQFSTLYQIASTAEKMGEKQRDSFQQASLVLWQQVSIYLSLSNTFWISGIDNIPEELVGYMQEIENVNSETLEWFNKRYQFLSDIANFDVLPPSEGETSEWLNMGKGLLKGGQDRAFHPDILNYALMIAAFQAKDLSSFQKHLNKLTNFSHRKTKFEVLYNQIQPFIICCFFYVVVFVFSLLSNFSKLKMLKKFAFYLFIATFVLQTIGLGARMYIEGRPPVTNLYSSAIFIGWGAVFFSLILEFFQKNSIGCIVGSIIGSSTLIIAHHLGGNGDTIQVMRAVLNSNFWLSTHVVTISLGYSATFLSGTLAVCYIFRGLFTKTFERKNAVQMAKSIYATICFSAFLSFIGTILGGFWADQSWGRFWGWDPKENGALLIILWNVLILHARIGGFIKNRGLMILAVFGNIVTALSWFGVNLLGIGLHSYGFMNGTFAILALFILSQCLIILLGMLPKRFWGSPQSL